MEQGMVVSAKATTEFLGDQGARAGHVVKEFLGEPFVPQMRPHRGAAREFAGLALGCLPETWRIHSIWASILGPCLFTARYPGASIFCIVFEWRTLLRHHGALAPPVHQNFTANSRPLFHAHAHASFLVPVPVLFRLFFRTGFHPAFTTASVAIFQSAVRTGTDLQLVAGIFGADSGRSIHVPD
jgi:hypothetical protein